MGMRSGNYCASYCARKDAAHLKRKWAKDWERANGVEIVLSSELGWEVLAGHHTPLEGFRSEVRCVGNRADYVS